jgi:membrane fusion protein, multidrug efflux system
MLLKSLAAAAVLLSMAACGGKAPAAAPGAAAVEVSAVTVQPRAVPVSTELAGRTAAFVSAEIRPQVGGIVLKRLFTEGGDVRAGQVLYQIDPPPSSRSVMPTSPRRSTAASGDRA